MKRYLVTILFGSFVFLFSCAKKEKIAPDLGEVKGPVEFDESFTVSNTNPNFANGDKVYFYAKFKNDAHWVLTLTGNTSTGMKKYEGTGTSISPSNVVWDGTTDSLPSFRKGETVVARLSFPEASSVPAVTLTYNIVIADVKNLNYGHVLVTDFSVDQIQNVYDGNFAAVPANKWPSNYPITVVKNDLPFKNPDGNQYCSMGPQAVWQDNADFPGHKSPYVDHMIITATSVGYPTYFPLIGNPQEIWFNIMIYNNTAAITNKYTWLQVTLFEDHPTQAGVTVAKSYNFHPNWNGWKLQSIPYANFVIGDGTTVLNNPQKIKSMQLTLLSSAPQNILDIGTGTGGNQVEVDFDHIIFSHFKPYQP
ncbi:MAG TPA: hypothetical protein VNB90_08745 [Cytophagaceae bacterium]|nr:hypothetical protein [Cytophagaceae bacterium]